jgi:hypothetical protein
MELALIVYFAGVVSSLNLALAVTLSFGSILVGVYSAWHVTDNPEGIPFKKWPIVSLVVLLLFLPSERTMWLMAGAYGTQSVIESQVGQDMKKLIELKVKGLVEEELAKVQKK